MKKLTVWSVIGSVWTAWYLFLLVYVTIPDYPYDWPLWESLTMDPNGYWHEVWYLTIGWLAGMAWLMVFSLWYHTCLFLNAMKRWLEKGFP